MEKAHQVVGQVAETVEATLVAQTTAQLSGHQGAG